jgi:methylated-DNA-protein-cysteine methyltransferase-like protein
MVRSDETEWWINAVYEAIKEIPFGRVTTYKHIAELLGTRKFSLLEKLHTRHELK